VSKVDRRLAFVNHLVEKYGTQVADLFNLNYQAPTSVGVGKVSDGHGAESSYGGGITFDRNFLKTTSRADLRGATIHELTHVEGAGYGKAKAETLADLARYHFNFGDPNWKPSAEVLAAAERRGVTPVAHPNGPRAGHGTGRNRNTTVNNASHGSAGGPPAPVSPGSAVNYAGQMAQTQLNYFQQLAAIKAQGGQLRADFAMSKAQAQQAAIANMAHTEAGALDRGIVNSSIDLGQRTGVIAERTTAIQAAIAARQAGRLGLKTARLNAGNDYYTQMFQIQAAKAAEQAQNAADALKQDQTIRAGDETAPGRDNRQTSPNAVTPPQRSATGMYDPTELYSYFIAQGNDAHGAALMTKNIMNEGYSAPPPAAPWAPVGSTRQQI
jgi:hypothetical protein